MRSRYKLAYLVSHPIQYQAPLLRYLAALPEIDLTVFYISDFSLHQYRDPGFAARFQWDVPLLGGYKHSFLSNLGGTKKVNALLPLGGLPAAALAGFDALWVHGYAHHINVRAIVNAKRMGLKVLLRGESHLRSGARSAWTLLMKKAALSYLFSNIDAFLAIGTLNRDYYIYYGVQPGRIFMMPYAVDNEFFQSRASAAQPNRGDLKRKLGLDVDRPVILFASKMVSWKRPLHLLEAYIRLSRDGRAEPEPYLLFVGDGEERDSLERRARQTGWSSIKFVGFKNQTELPLYYDLCDVFVLASEYEPWGLAINEVLNAGKPVIVSDQVGSACDLVRDGENGFVVRDGDVGALSDRLAILTRDSAFANIMGRRGLARVSQWNFEADGTGLIAALRSVCGEDAAVGVTR